MIMDLPEKFFMGNAKKKNDAYIEDGILKIRKTASFRHAVYELTFRLNGGNRHTCCYCNKTFKNQRMTMDHIYPQYMGGPTITNNLCPSCQLCNSQKSNMTLDEFTKYRNINGDNDKKQYLKQLNSKKEKMRRDKKYQIPDEWIYQKELSTIFVDMRLECSSQRKKYISIEKFYSEYGYFPKPIIVDKNGFLLDGFYTVMFAKDHQIPKVPAIQLENVEVIF